MSRPGVYADWQVCLDLFMPTDTQIPYQWSAADIVGEALPALSFLCYVRYDQSLDLIESLVDEEVPLQPVGTFSEVGPKLRKQQKKTKKSYVKLKEYKLRKLRNFKRKA
jgi:hypothetical protein